MSPEEPIRRRGSRHPPPDDEIESLNPVESRRLFLALLLSLAVMIGWGYLVGPPEPPPPAVPEEGIQAPGEAVVSGEAGETAVPPAEAAEAVSEEAAVEAAAPERAAAAEPLPEVRAESEALVTLGTGRATAVFSNRGAQLVSFVLEDHVGDDGERLDLVRRRRSGVYPFGLWRAGGGHPLNDALFVAEETPLGVTFRYGGPEGYAEKRFRIRDDGLVELVVEVAGEDDWGLVLGPGIRNAEADKESRFGRKGVVYKLGEDVESVSELDDGSITLPGAGLAWVGLEDNYFLSVLMPAVGSEVRQILVEAVSDRSLAAPPEGGAVEVAGEDDEQEEGEPQLLVVVEPRGERLAGLSYWGAKQLERLKELPGDLEETINLSPGKWFEFLRILAEPLLLGLHWIYENVTRNYGWAIVLMTLAIKLLLLPLTHKSYVSMRKMQELSPKMQAIRAKYRGKLKDKQGRPNLDAQRKMNEETMALYKSEGVNPAGGCLPMLLQMPVFFAFYLILAAAVELRHAPWMLWIQDLSVRDPYYVLPIVMGGTQLLQQRMTPTAGDPMQRRIFQMMPIVMTFLFLGFPAGLVLYWLTNNVLTIAQQWTYNHLKSRGERKAAPPEGKKKKSKAKRESRG